MTIFQSINAPTKIFTIADCLDINDDRMLFRGCEVAILDGLDGMGGMVADYSVRFVQTADEIAEILAANELEDNLPPFWGAAEVDEFLLDDECPMEMDFSQLNA